MIVFLIIIAAVLLAVYLFMQQLKFGSIASGDRLRKIEQSPQYKVEQSCNKHQLKILGKVFQSRASNNDFRTSIESIQ